MCKLEDLKAFRREQGISVEGLARQLNLSCTYVSQIENGHAAPALGFMRKLKIAYPDFDVNVFFKEVQANDTSGSSNE